MSLSAGLLAGAAGAAAGWMGMRSFGNRLVYPRSRMFRAEKEEAGLEVEDVEFAAADGTPLHGWWFPHPDAKGALLMCHGNAGNVSDRLWMAADLADVPLHKFIFDYRGYGRSRGRPSEKGTGLDVAAAWEVCRARVDGDVANPPIAIYGRSLGGAVALQAAERLPVRGVILESTFTSILEIGLRQYKWLLPRATCRNPYRSDLRIHRVKAPVLMAHSPDDLVVPLDMGETLFRRAPNPWGFVELAGPHNEAGWQTSPAYAAALRRFLDEVIQPAN